MNYYLITIERNGIYILTKWNNQKNNEQKRESTYLEYYENKLK